MKHFALIAAFACLSVSVCRAQEDSKPVKKPAKPSQRNTKTETTTKANVNARPKTVSAREIEIIRELLDRDWQDRPEWAVMALSIAKNEPMGNGRGWFKPSKRSYDWIWLTKRYPAKTKDNILKPDEADFLTDREFEKLDRNEDGGISRHDFDWSKGNPLMSGFNMTDMVFDKLDLDLNGRVSKEEMLEWFDKAGEGFDFLTMDDLRKALDLKPPNMLGGGGKRPNPRKMQQIMMQRFLNGELGSLTDGPKVGDPAPEINLPLLSRQERTKDQPHLKLTDRFVTLKEFKNKKPVVLIFGSFT